MEWLDQALQSRWPLAALMAIAIVALTRAYMAKDGALAAAQQARIDDLKDVIRRAGREDDD